MDRRNENFRIPKGRHVQSESTMLSKMQRRLIGSEHERIERIMKEHRRALFLQLNGPNSTWRLGEVKSAKDETEHVDRRASRYPSEQEFATTDRAEFSIRRDILSSAQTQKSRGSQRHLRSRQSGRSKGHRIHNSSSTSEIENKNADVCEKSNSSPIFDESYERKISKYNEYSAASNNDELRPGMQELNGMDLKKGSSQQKADENNVIDVTVETDLEKNDNTCAFEGKSTNGDKRDNLDGGHGDRLDQNLVSQRAEIFKSSLQNEKPLLPHSEGSIVRKVIADDEEWIQPSPPLTSIHDKFIKTNRFFAVSRRKSNSDSHISKAIPETQPTDDVKPTVLFDSSNTDSSTTQKGNALLRDKSMLTKYKPKEESEVDVLEILETVPGGRKITFHDDLHQSEPLASEVREIAPSSRTHVIRSTECKKSDHNEATTRQLAFPTAVMVQNCPLKTGRFSFKGKGVTIPQATDIRKSESLPPRLCSKNAWAPKVSITWEENEPMRVCLLPPEGSMRKRLTFREHKDLWPHVKIVVILRMLDGEHYYREIK